MRVPSLLSAEPVPPVGVGIVVVPSIQPRGARGGSVGDPWSTLPGTTVPHRRGGRFVVREDHRGRAPGRAGRRPHTSRCSSSTPTTSTSATARSPSARRSTSTTRTPSTGRCSTTTSRRWPPAPRCRCRSTTTSQYNRSGEVKHRPPGADRGRRGDPRAVGADAAGALRPQGVRRHRRRHPPDPAPAARRRPSAAGRRERHRAVPARRCARPTSSSSSRASATPTSSSPRAASTAPRSTSCWHASSSSLGADRSTR